MKSLFDTIFLVACLSTALALRLVVILGQPEQLAIDRDAYIGIATSVAEGRGFSSPNSSTPTAFRPPIYPLALALGFRLFPQLPIVAEINLIAGLMTVWLTARLGEHLRLGRLRFLAAFLVAIDPLLLQYSARPMTESVCAFLATLWLWSLISGRPDQSIQNEATDLQGEPGCVSPRTLQDISPKTDSLHLASESSIGSRLSVGPLRGLINGITFGLLVLSRPTFWPIAGFCGIGWLASLRTLRKTKNNSKQSSDIKRWSMIWNAIGAIVGTALIVAPWVIRNWLVMGVPILTTTHGGYTLLLGNNPVFYNEVVSQPWGTVWPDASQTEWEEDRKSQFEKDVGPQTTEVDEDGWNARQAKNYIVAEPWHCAQAILHRIRSLWSTGPQGDAALGASRSVVIATGWYYFLVLTTSLAGMVLALRRVDRSCWLPLFVLIVSVQLVHLMYWTNTRMRAPLTPAIALFAAATVCRKPFPASRDA